MGLVVNYEELAAKAHRRGLSLSSLAAKAGVSRNTMAKIRRGEEVNPSISADLNKALDELPELEHVQLTERSA